MGVLCVLAGLAAASAAEAEPGGKMLGVHELTAADFERGTAVPALVWWYSTSTPFCRRLAPEYARVGAALHAAGVTSVRVAKFNHEQPGAGPVEAARGVAGFPHVAALPGGTAGAATVEFTDHRNRTAARLARFIVEALAPACGDDCAAALAALPDDAAPAAEQAAAAEAEEPADPSQHWSANHWYYWLTKKERASKLLTLGQLRRKVKRGVVGPDSLVAKAGAPEWLPARTVPELAVTMAERDLDSVTFEGDPGAKARGVVDLTPDNIDQQLAEKRDWFVEFYAPWCGHCQQMAGDWSRLGRSVSYDAAAAKSIRVGKMDSTAPGADMAAARHGVSVRGYPTVVHISAAGKVTAHSGERKLDGFLSFVQQQTGVRVSAAAAAESAALVLRPSSAMAFVDELRPDSFAAAVSDGRHWLVEFYADGCGFCKKLAPQWKLLAARAAQRGLRLAVGKFSTEQAGTKEIESRYGVEGFPTLLLFTDGGKDVRRFTDNRHRTAARILQWVEEEVPDVVPPKPAPKPAAHDEL